MARIAWIAAGMIPLCRYLVPGPRRGANRIGVGCRVGRAIQSVPKGRGAIQPTPGIRLSPSRRMNTFCSVQPTPWILFASDLRVRRSIP